MLIGNVLTRPLVQVCAEVRRVLEHCLAGLANAYWPRFLSELCIYLCHSLHIVVHLLSLVLVIISFWQVGLGS